MSDTSTPRLNDTPRINVTEATDNTNAGSTTSEPFWKHITRTSPVVPEDIPEEDVIHLQDSRPRSSSSKANRSPKMSGSAKQGRRDKKSTNLSVPLSGGKENTQKEITEEMRISTPIQRESTNVSLDAESWMSVDARIYPTMVTIAADENPQTVLSPGQTWIGAAIPYLPLGLAILCLIMNIFIPGSELLEYFIKQNCNTILIITICVYRVIFQQQKILILVLSNIKLPLRLNLQFFC
ncbi:hypothetical protein ACJMK2_036352 [Sinanodonta woodiana]|uniref:Uncharacterized protein n=1 Tax=Sinanodonta woodiana TaxID=1069815 RepID=A0ABD3WI46_SINWO